MLISNPRFALFTLLFLSAASILYNAFLPLHGDEAYYWLWSHRLQTGYYDHPPMIAWLIALSNYVSEAEWGVRLVNVAAMATAAGVIYTLTAQLKDKRTATWGVLIFASVILVHAGYTIVTPDSPLILFWSLALLATGRVITRGATRDFALAGAAIGLMMLSKYTAILYVFALLLFMALRRRDLFVNPRTLLAIGVALLVISPMLWWNAQHEWISFTFQLHHGEHANTTLHWNWPTELIGAQFAVFTPVFAAILFTYLFGKPLFYRDDTPFFLALVTIIPLLFFLYKSFTVHIELNYTAPAYVSGTILCAYAFGTFKTTRWLRIGLITALTLSIIARIALIGWLEVVQDRMYGNKEAVQMLNQHRRDGDTLYANHLTIAALVTYYLDDHPITRIPTPSRFSQYDMWETGKAFGAGLYLAYEPMEAALKRRFATVTLVDTLPVKRKTFYLYRVE